MSIIKEAKEASLSSLIHPFCNHYLFLQGFLRPQIFFGTCSVQLYGDRAVVKIVLRSVIVLDFFSPSESLTNRS
jgi:hypothetical protein